MKKKNRIVHEYHLSGETIFTLGHANYIKAQPPLSSHDHANMMEFVYIVKGSQTYRTGNENYLVSKGEVFFTRPHELHSTGMYPEEKSEIYYLIVDMSLASKMGIFLSHEEYASVCNLWNNTPKRTFTAAPSLHGSLKRLMTCFDRRDLYFDSHVRNALSEVMISLSTPQHACHDQTDSGIEKSLEYIHTHLDEPLRVSSLPILEHMSLSAYNKAFVQAMGIPPGEYILKCKIEKAKELLATTDLSVTDITFRLGFSSSQYFATVFKRFSCKTPSEYRSFIKA